MVKAQTYAGVTRVLRAHGWVLLRRAKGSHEIWGRPGSAAERGSLPHHRVVSAGVVRQLAAALGFTPNEWL